jgi:cardiolipin synthase
LGVKFSRFGEGGYFRRHFLWAMERARRSILIAHGDSLPEGWIVRSILAAARRGVCVYLLTPGEHRSPLSLTAIRRLRRRLLSSGVRVYECNGPMLYAKVACIDARCLLIGNLDSYGFSSAKSEVLVETTEGSVVEDGERWILERLQNAKAVTTVEVGSWWRRWLWEPCRLVIARLAEGLSHLAPAVHLPVPSGVTSRMRLWSSARAHGSRLQRTARAP